MSMIGEYLRLEPGDLQRVMSDPDAAYEWIEDLDDARDPRRFDTDKAWHALAFVLERAGVPDAVVYGEDEIPGADDWGYGPPRSLRPARVRELSDLLQQLKPAEAVTAVAAAEFTAEEIYPQFWKDAGHDWLIHHLNRLTEFFREATDDGMGMILWIG